MNDTNIEEYWRPLRNVLRNTNLLDSLGVVRAYSVYRHLGRNYPMPSDIEVDASFYSDWKVLLPWELETLAREILIISNPEIAPRKDLKRWRDLSSAINKLKAIEEAIAKSYIGQKNIYNEVTVRLAHRQFRYQTEMPSNESIVRYYRLYKEPEVAELVEKTLGISPLEIIRLGAGLWANYCKNLGMYYPLEKLELSGISQVEYDKFMSIFSIEMPKLQEMMRSSEHRKLDDTFLYSFHELHQYPIIFTEMNNRPTHICPQPTLLFWRITTGIFYDMVNIKGFDQAFGDSFEKYIGDVTLSTLESGNYELFSEEDNTGPNRCDWIIDGDSSFLIVGCKTKRPTLALKTSLSGNEVMDEQLEILAKAAVQSYKTLEAYRKGLYKKPKYKFDQNKNPYIAVVTLEKWYLMGVRLRELNEKVVHLLEIDGLDGVSLVKEVPFVVLSMSEYEEFAYLLSKSDLGSLIDPSLNSEKYSGWEFSQYLRSEFKDELSDYSFIFRSELDTIFQTLNDE